MGLGPFSLISLIFAVLGIRVIAGLVNNWEKVWDHRFTMKDRDLVDRSAFFVLIPVSVALHELGHAVAIWIFGGTVTGWGFYGFAGYVSYIPAGFTPTQMTLVSFAGTLVNLLLCVGALALVFFWGFRAAINELLIQFAIISGANAFILYPLLDLASDLNGDWRQMYDSEVPWLTALIIVVQLAVIAFGFYMYSNPGMKARLSKLTDVPGGMERGFLGGVRPGTIDVQALSPSERVLREACERVQSGWHAKVETGMQRFDKGTAMTLAWRRGTQAFAIAARTYGTGRTDIVALNTRGEDRRPQLIQGWTELPSTDELTVALRIAMETVEQGA